MIFDDPLVLLGMYIACLGPVGFLFGICSNCCPRECFQFLDDFQIKVGRLVSWGNSTPALDTDGNPITISANSGRVLSIAEIFGVPYALVEYEDSGTKTAWIAFSDLTKEIDDWWHICSGGWEIDGGILKSTSAGTMTFLITEDTPYGTFTANMYWIAGVEYIMYVRKGDDADDECGAADQTIKFVPTGNLGEWKIFADGELKDDIYETQGSAFSRNGVCVDSKGVAVIVDGVRRYQVCTVPGQYYFAIGASASGTEWTDVCYTDHYDHNPNCPKCQPPCCFQNFDQTIEGFDVTISGVANGFDCNCPATFEIYFALEVNGICECAQAVSAQIAFPGGAGQCDESNLALALNCGSGGDPIALGVTLTPSVGTGVEWSFLFAAGTAPGDVSATSELPLSPGDENVCDFSNARITITPRLTTGCCGGEPEENPFP